MEDYCRTARKHNNCCDYDYERLVIAAPSCQLSWEGKREGLMIESLRNEKMLSSTIGLVLSLFLSLYLYDIPHFLLEIG